MILDEVLYESSSFDMDDMVDIFTEGFLYALEMQEVGYKAGSTEKLSENLVEAAETIINEKSAVESRRTSTLAKLAKKMRKEQDNHYYNAAVAKKNGDLQKNMEERMKANKKSDRINRINSELYKRM